MYLHQMLSHMKLNHMTKLRSFLEVKFMPSMNSENVIADSKVKFCLQSHQNGQTQNSPPVNCMNSASSLCSAPAGWWSLCRCWDHHLRQNQEPWCSQRGHCCTRTWWGCWAAQWGPGWVSEIGRRSSWARHRCTLRLRSSEPATQGEQHSSFLVSS